MSKKIGTFIFVHDQEIVLDFINCEKFQVFENLTFVFVGNKDTSKIENISNVVICKNLVYNIEEYPKLTSYTGWYAIWKNELYKEYDYLNLFEYDVNILENFNESQSEVLESGLVGYIPLSINNSSYIRVKKWSEEIILSIKEKYDTDIYKLVDNLDKNFNCSITSNHTFSKINFENYMLWVEPLVEDIKDLEMAGHQIERSISFFYLVNNIEFKILPYVLKHFQFDSHKTQGISQEKFNTNYKKLL
jgi:hypothetical protein